MDSTTVEAARRDLIREARKYVPIDELLGGRELTDEERVELLCLALNLCTECKWKAIAHLNSLGRSFTQTIREQIWEEWSFWEHGRECPPDASR